MKDFTRWLADLEAFFEINKILEDQKVKFVWCYDEILDWWHGIQSFRIRKR